MEQASTAIVKNLVGSLLIGFALYDFCVSFRALFFCTKCQLLRSERCFYVFFFFSFFFFFCTNCYLPMSGRCFYVSFTKRCHFEFCIDMTSFNPFRYCYNIRVIALSKCLNLSNISSGVFGNALNFMCYLFLHTHTLCKCYMVFVLKPCLFKKATLIRRGFYS